MVSNACAARKMFAGLLASIVLLQTCSACWADTEQTAEQIEAPEKIAAESAPPQTILSGAASMTPNAANDRIDDLTKEILLKIIELERFNLHYTLEVAKQGRWKGWRYAGLQEVNAGMGLAGAIIGTAERGYHIHSPGRVYTVVQEAANYVPMIGSIIGASAAAMEFSINSYHDLMARKKGFSPAVARKYVLGIKMDIDRRMADRDALIKVQSEDPALAYHVQVDNAEGKVLKDLRDQALQEFERFHIGARKLLAFQQMQYFFDFSKYTLNAIGYDFAYLSLHRHRRLWNGRAGVMWDIAGPLYMTGPVISRLFSNGVVAKVTKHTLKETMQDARETTVALLQADLNTLNELCKGVRVANATEDAVVHSSMYGLHERTFSDEVQSAEKKRAAARLTATQNIGSGFYIGGTKLAQGVLFTIPGFNQHYNKKGFRADHVTNDLLFVGSVISLPAGLYSMLDTLRIQVKGELQRHKLAKAGMLPQQLVGKRLGELDEMEKVLKTM